MSTPPEGTMPDNYGNLVPLPAPRRTVIDCFGSVVDLTNIYNDGPDPEGEAG